VTSREKLKQQIRFLAIEDFNAKQGPKSAGQIAEEHINIYYKIYDTLVVRRKMPKVNINTANVARLYRLPELARCYGKIKDVGYNKCTDAGKIVKYRSENGPFTDVKQLADLGLVGRTTFPLVEPWLYVGPRGLDESEIKELRVLRDRLRDQMEAISQIVVAALGTSEALEDLLGES
jgi:hypothetical protein